MRDPSGRHFVAYEPGLAGEGRVLAEAVGSLNSGIPLYGNPTAATTCGSRTTGPASTGYALYPFSQATSNQGVAQLRLALNPLPIGRLAPSRHWLSWGRVTSTTRPLARSLPILRA